jgi:hypothetical protein
MIYDYRKQIPCSPAYELNPEIIESAWYLYDYTKDARYIEMGKQYYNDILKYCKTTTAFSSVADVRSKQLHNELPTYFFAATMKYLYLLFTPDTGLNTAEYVFNTEAHPFRIMDFKASETGRRLGITP